MSAARTKILVADELSAEGMEILGRVGEVTTSKGMDEDTLRATLPDYHVLIVRSATVVTARSLELAENLAVIGRAGIGVDNIDVGAATERGIVVMNTPEASATTTGELAVSLMMSLARNIPAADAAMQDGRWEKSKFTGAELTGKVMGVLGLGRIGRVVAERARGLHMEVVAFDPHVDESHAPPYVRLLSLEELLGEADFVSVHVPLLDGTRHLLSAEQFGQMKRGAPADPRRPGRDRRRGGALRRPRQRPCRRRCAGRVRAGATAREPPASQPAQRDPDAAPRGEHRRSQAQRVAEHGEPRSPPACSRASVLNGVNVPHVAPADANRVAPFLRLAHSLASFVAQIFEGPVESLRLTLQGELPAAAAVPLRVATLAGCLQHRGEGPVTPVNAERHAEALGVRVHTEISTLKRDFVNLIRIEAVMGGERHIVTGTVLGNRHIRMIELDAFMLDAIPEGPLLVTFHRDVPGVVGKIGTALGREDINISRLQLGAVEESQSQAFAIWNLSTALTEDGIERLRAEDDIVRAYRVSL